MYRWVCFEENYSMITKFQPFPHSVFRMGVSQVCQFFQFSLWKFCRFQIAHLRRFRACLIHDWHIQGERKRKSVRGCIVDGNLSVLSMAIIKKGEAEIPGLTDNTIPRRLGPKRASKIRKLFNLTKEDDVCQYVIKRPLPLKVSAY